MAPTAAFAQASASAPPDQPGAPVPYDRFEEFVNDSVKSPLFYVQAVGAGVLDQLGNFPTEWKGGSAFAKRNAARTGQAFAAEAVGHAAAAVLHHRVAYDPCTCTGLPRVGHAIARAFVSLKSDGSGRAPNWSLWISKYASAGLANAWYPTTYTTADVASQGTAALGTAAGLNIVKEFAPEILRLAHLR
jgi:hypothetical protein